MLAKKVKGFANLVRLISFRDIQTYRRLKHLSAGTTVTLRPRALGGRVEVLCRSGTTDRMVLWDAYVYGYHLPIAPIREDGVILDLGANVGYTVAHLATKYPRARVVGVEMDPDNAAMACRNTQSFGERVQIIEAAIWTDDGEIHYGGDTAFGFRVSSVSRTEHDNNHRVSPAININTLCQRLGIETIDYVKMDIEGAEAHVLYRNNDWLNRVNAMNLEVHTPAKRTDCIKHLESFGFECRKHPTHPWGVTARRLLTDIIRQSGTANK